MQGSILGIKFRYMILDFIFMAYQIYFYMLPFPNCIQILHFSKDEINGGYVERTEQREGLSLKGEYTYSDGFFQRTGTYLIIYLPI